MQKHKEINRKTAAGNHQTFRQARKEVMERSRYYMGQNKIKIKLIHVQSKSNLHFLVYSDSRLIYSEYRGETVYCIDDSGKLIWQYKHDLLGPEGLCTDTYGNTIVADWSSSRIIAISKDGQDSKLLVKNEEGLIILSVFV